MQQQFKSVLKSPFVPQHYRKAVTLQCQLFFEGGDIENIDSRAASVGLRSLRNLKEDR